MMSLLFRITLMFAIFAGLGHGAFGQNITGTYTLVKDSDGQTPKQTATISISFKAAGSLSMDAEQPGESATDTGTYSVRGNLITLHFKEMVWAADRQPFTLDGCTLTLPFMALKDTAAGGTSIWQKQGCSAERSAEKAANRSGAGSQGEGSGAAGGASKGKSGGNASASAPGGNGSKSAAQPGGNKTPPSPNNSSNSPSDAQPVNLNASKQPSCSNCDYVPCLRESIKQKQELKAVYGHLAALYGKFYFQKNAKGEQEPVETVNGGITSVDDFQYLLKVHANYTAKETELTAAVETPPSCHYDSGLNLQLSTHAFNCQLDIAGANALESAVPCHQLYDFAMEHEQVHINACLARKDKGTPHGSLLITPYGKAKEEMAAYDVEIAKLTTLLQGAEAKCRFTCGCTGRSFATSAECQANCRISLACPFSAANSCIHPDKEKGKPQYMPLPR